MSGDFELPGGALLEYLGAAKWSCHCPGTRDVLPFFYAEANSYALDTGGIRGMLWNVIAVEKVLDGGLEVLQVTVQPADSYEAEGPQ